MNSDKTILFLASGPAAPGTEEANNPFFYLSSKLNGFVVGSTWPNADKLEAENYIKSIQPSFGRFKYLTFRRHEKFRSLRNIIHFINYIKIGSKLLKFNKIDHIVCYGFLVPGMAASFLSWWYKVPLIVEVPGVPDKAIKFLSTRFKALAALILKTSIYITLKQASAVWMLYPGQLSNPILKDKKIFIFHEFSPVSLFKPREVSSPIISFLGFPWKLKGVDILIRAFVKISDKYPAARLRIAGYCPDRSEFENLRQGFEDKIDFFDGLNRKEAIEYVESTNILVVPSRTEAMGRVILEGMAAGKLVIGSKVDGIPYYIEDGVNGLLFESENVEDLSKKLVLSLSDEQSTEVIRKNAKKCIVEKYSETDFVDSFSKMIAEVTK